MWRPVEVELRIDEFAALKLHCRKLYTAVIVSLTKLPIVLLRIDNFCRLVKILITTCKELIKETCKTTCSPEVRSLRTRVVSSHCVTYRSCSSIILIEEWLHPREVIEEVSLEVVIKAEILNLRYNEVHCSSVKTYEISLNLHIMHIYSIKIHATYSRIKKSHRHWK